MARCNAFIEAGNENRQVSVGGRRRSDSVWAWLNTDNHKGQDCSIRVRAEVVGEKTRTSDTRKSVFTIELPEETDPEACEVRIEKHGAMLEAIARFGAVLCVAKGAGELASDNPAKGKATIAAARKIWRELDEEAKRQTFPNVTLPGGVSLAKALAAVKIMDQLFGEGGGGN